MWTEVGGVQPAGVRSAPVKHRVQCGQFGHPVGATQGPTSVALLCPCEAVPAAGQQCPPFGRLPLSTLVGDAVHLPPRSCPRTMAQHEGAVFGHLLELRTLAMMAVDALPRVSDYVSVSSHHHPGGCGGGEIGLPLPLCVGCSAGVECVRMSGRCASCPPVAVGVESVRNVSSCRRSFPQKSYDPGQIGVGGDMSAMPEDHVSLSQLEPCFHDVDHFGDSLPHSNGWTSRYCDHSGSSQPVEETSIVTPSLHASSLHAAGSVGRGNAACMSASLPSVLPAVSGVRCQPEMLHILSGNVKGMVFTDCDSPCPINVSPGLLVQSTSAGSRFQFNLDTEVTFPTSSAITSSPCPNRSVDHSLLQRVCPVSSWRQVVPSTARPSSKNVGDGEVDVTADRLCRGSAGVSRHPGVCAPCVDDDAVSVPLPCPDGGVTVEGQAALSLKDHAASGAVLGVAAAAQPVSSVACLVPGDVRMTRPVTCPGSCLVVPESFLVADAVSGNARSPRGLVGCVGEWFGVFLSHSPATVLLLCSVFCISLTVLLLCSVFHLAHCVITVFCVLSCTPCYHCVATVFCCIDLLTVRLGDVGVLWIRSWSLHAV